MTEHDATTDEGLQALEQAVAAGAITDNVIARLLARVRVEQRIAARLRYWVSQPKSRGQAEAMLSCGHLGPMGAPCCLSCAKSE